MMHTPAHKQTKAPAGQVAPVPTQDEINQRIADKINEEHASGLDGGPDDEGDDE